MRLNVYSQELISDDHSGFITESVEDRKADTGVIYSAVRLFLHSSSRLHEGGNDDDRSAVTFWLPKSPIRREHLAKTFEYLAYLIRKASPETGLD